MGLRSSLSPLLNFFPIELLRIKIGIEININKHRNRNNINMNRTRNEERCELDEDGILTKHRLETVDLLVWLWLYPLYHSFDLPIIIGQSSYPVVLSVVALVWAVGKILLEMIEIVKNTNE